MKRILSTLALVAGLLFGALASPIAHAGALSDYAENKLIDAVLRGQALGAPATGYIRLDTTTCTDAGPGTEVTGGAYARQAVTASLANWAGTQGAGTTVASTGTSGTTSNNTVITFPESTAAWGNLQSVKYTDAVSAGNTWFCIDLTTPFNVSAAGVTVKFNPGTLQLQFDN